MRADRYRNIVLTIIAIELLWLGVKGGAPAVSAQGPTAVTITGIALDPQNTGYLPVGLVGTFRQVPRAHAASLERPRVQIVDPVPIHTTTPIKVEADRPLPVRAVREPGSLRPGH